MALQQARNEWNEITTAAEEARDTIANLFKDFDKLDFESLVKLEENLRKAGIEAKQV
jgi:hypothetical protein